MLFKVISTTLSILKGCHTLERMDLEECNRVSQKIFKSFCLIYKIDWLQF